MATRKQRKAIRRALFSGVTPEQFKAAFDARAAVAQACRTMAEILTQPNDIWDAMPMNEDGGARTFTFRTSIPTTVWRDLNGNIVRREDSLPGSPPMSQQG